MAAATLAVLLSATPSVKSAAALAMFCLAAVVLSVVTQEFWRGARARARISGSPLPTALIELVVRNRRRYGGYVVHAGMAILFLGAAASSAFEAKQDARLMSGQSTTVGPYTVTYREPTAEILSDRAGTGAPITLGAVLDVEGSGERFVLRPSRNYYPSQDASLGAIGRFFEGEATSEVALDSNLGRDVWTAVQPDLNALEGPIREANRRFATRTARS
ncbi:MAG: cytochrome c-type biogenesis CcmF C-terminal domain-containing protein [Thermoleophilaceae bacterium]